VREQKSSVFYGETVQQLHRKRPKHPRAAGTAALSTVSELTSTVQDPINLAFIQQLRVLRFDRFEFDGNFLSGSHVGA
jgi:hypothetical protein